MKRQIVIAGGGFKGFCDALALVDMSDTDVHIVEPAPFFGGIMNSIETMGYFVDKGVHVFDSVPKALGDVVEDIMEGAVHEIDFVSASAYKNQVTDGFSLPDLSHLDESKKAQIILELVRLASQPDRQSEAKTLRELFEFRYGQTVSEIFSNIFSKVYGVSAEEVEARAISQTSLGRLKFLDDAEMLVLKSNPWLETVLAARRKSMGKIDDLVSVYPSDGEAMAGWCKRAVPWLTKKGVKVHLSESIKSINEVNGKLEVATDKQVISADKLLWSNDNTDALSVATGIASDASELQYGTPLMFLIMETQADQIKDFTYLQNFDEEGITYRTAAAGLFSNQITEDGRSFITSECPVKPGNTFWENPASMIQPAWEECKNLGIVGESATLLASKAVKIPVSFKLPRVGYQERVNKLREEVLNKFENVLLRDVTTFFRREIYLDSMKLKDSV